MKSALQQEDNNGVKWEGTLEPIDKGRVSITLELDLSEAEKET